MKRIFSITIAILYIIEVHGQVDLNAGLVGYYPFTGNANDVSGNNNHGTTQNGIQLTSDIAGNLQSAYYFDGIDDYISVPDNLGRFSTANFSLSLWFKTETNDLQNLIGKRNYGPTSGQQYQFFINYAPFPGIGSNIISDLNSCPVGITSLTSYINTGEDICIGRWYSAVVTFDGVLHKIYINGILKRSVPAGFNSMARCNSELRFGNWWQGDLIPFKGVMDEIRWYNRTLNEDEVKALSQPLGNFLNADFTYEQNICQPGSIQFNNISTGSINANWDFGDGTSIAGDTDPVHVYTIPGIYNVTLITRSGANCYDTSIKAIDLRIGNNILIQNSDTSICFGDSVRLRSSVTDQYCWMPDVTIQQPDSAQTFVKPTIKTTYVLRGMVSNANLVVNGDFENGNSGFNSDYTFVTSRSNDGQYGVNSDARQWYPALACATCGDHSNGSTGKMLIADGDVTANKKLWCQNIKVSPNSSYVISFWGIAYGPQNIPLPELYINDRKAGDLRISAQDANRWKQFVVTWSSGTDTLLNLCIQNANTSQTGNVFAIDDIGVMLSEIAIDSVTVDVVQNTNVSASPDTDICRGESLQLDATGGTEFLWFPVTGLTDPRIANPIASPQITTTYIVTASNNGICAGKDTVVVTVNPRPLINITPDTSICAGNSIQLSANGGQQYNWSPQAGLDNSFISNPIASPLLTTTYKVKVTDGNGCFDSKQVKIKVAPKGKVYVPNAFTPNGDGINDCFGIKGAEGAVNFEIAVFNRYGERVYYSKDPDACWNGLYKGQEQPSGSFVYYLNMRSPCNLINTKGNITLIR